MPKIVKTKTKRTEFLATPAPLGFKERQALTGKRESKKSEPYILHKPKTIIDPERKKVAEKSACRLHSKQMLAQVVTPTEPMHRDTPQVPSLQTTGAMTGMTKPTPEQEAAAKLSKFKKT